MDIIEHIAEKAMRPQKSTDNLEQNCLLIREGMEKPKRILLLRILDEKDRLIDNAACDGFRRGFILGLNIGMTAGALDIPLE